MTSKKVLLLAILTMISIFILSGCNFILPETATEADNTNNSTENGTSAGTGNSTGNGTSAGTDNSAGNNTSAGTGNSTGNTGDLPLDLETLKGSWQVNVMLQDADGITVTSRNPISIGAGSEASFSINLNPNYKITGINHDAVYHNGAVTVSDVWFPTTVELHTRTRYQYKLTIENNSDDGTVFSSATGDTVMEDSPVTLTATAANGRLFTGFSIDQPQSKGGKIVSTNPSYTFTMTENVKIVANYFYFGNGNLLTYDSNGGDQPLQYDAFFNTSYFLCPRTFLNTNHFTREGYVLYGYNTEADGSGTYYGTGWNIPMKSGQVKLYAQWMKASPAEDFTYKITKNAVTIERYNGDDELVVIPETIEGFPVTAVSSGTFVEKSFHTLYINKNIQTFESGAVQNCKNFTTLYLCDAVRSISDGSFSKCPNLKRLYVLACLAPCCDGTYLIKYQRLITMPDPKLIIISGSNSLYGVNSPLLEELIGYRYHILNYGCNADTPATFYTEVVSNFIRSGDLILFQPEPNTYQFGYSRMNPTTWQIFEGAPEAYSLVDIRNYSNMFNSFAAYNDARYTMTPYDPEEYSRKSVNEYGDYIRYKAGTVMQGKIDAYLANGGFGSSVMNEDLLTDDNMKKINRLFDAISAKGAKIYVSFASYMKIALTEEEQTEEAIAIYKQAVIDNVHGTVISDPATYLMDHRYFYNTNFHLNTEGSNIRTENLAKDLLRQFAKEQGILLPEEDDSAEQSGSLTEENDSLTEENHSLTEQNDFKEREN